MLSTLKVKSAKPEARELHTDARKLVVLSAFTERDGVCCVFNHES
ncbi:MAG: hypothetical protein Q7J51_04335 [Sheuella sp.]|nr:hypothetical protein [Sheuella sp.]